MAVSGIPTLTVATYAAIILLFVVSALYVGWQFEPLPAEEIQAMVDEGDRSD
jgi:hypothetical protein